MGLRFQLLTALLNTHALSPGGWVRSNSALVHPEAEAEVEAMVAWNMMDSSSAYGNILTPTNVTDPQIHGEVDQETSVSDTIEATVSNSRPVDSLPDSLYGEESDSDLSEGRFDSGDMSMTSSSDIGSSSHSLGGRPSGSLRSRQHHSNYGRGRPKPMISRKPLRRNSQRPIGFGIGSAVPPTERRPASRKRRRISTLSENEVASYVASGHQLVASLGHCVVRTHGMDAFRDLSPVLNDVRRYLTEMQRSECRRKMSQPTGLNFGQYKHPHAASTLTKVQTLTPSLSLIGTPHILFTSEIIPRALDTRKRLRILSIFRSRLFRIPTCVMSTIDGQVQEYHVLFAAATSHSGIAGLEGLPVVPLGPNGQGWPGIQVPLELFEQIGDHLPQSDLKSMRLVNKEFESKISPKLFKSAVVAFRPEIYGMIAPDTESSVYAAGRNCLSQHIERSRLADPKGKGKGKGKKEFHCDKIDANQGCRNAAQPGYGWN